MVQLVLASSSPYRRALLARLGLPFHWASPDVDETPGASEGVEALVQRLALAKARALGTAHPGALLIGSDQACQLGGRILGKPHTAARAREQLTACSGQRVTFYTALVLFDSGSGQWQQSVDRFTVGFRQLASAEIDHYLHTEQPYDCAGSFKVEGLGVALFDTLEGADYHSLVGLPLLSLCAMLRKAGLNPLLPAVPVPH